MTSTSKNVYIDKSDNIVNECNNNTIEQLTWNQLMLKIIHILTQWNCIQQSCTLIKILNLKLVIMKEFPNKKIFLLKGTHQIGPKKFL